MDVPSILPNLPDYVFGDKLGKGTYGIVYKACRRGTGGREQIAIKCLLKKRISGKTCDNLIEEIRILKTIRNDFVVHFIDFQWDVTYIYLIFEYCSLGDLASYLRRQNANNSASLSLPRRRSPLFPEPVVKNFLQQLASALKALHEHQVSHFDLKPQNILMSKKNIFHSDGLLILKLADFGFAKVLTEDDNTVSDLRGTPLYMAPEVVMKSEYDASADLWSVGIILYEILYGKTPFHSSSVSELLSRLQKDSIRVPTSVAVSSDCHDLLVRLLQKDRRRRISFSDFFAHPFLSLEYMPSFASYQKGCKLVNQAVEEDKKGNVFVAIEQYLNSLDYLLPILHFGLPLNEETGKLNLTRKSLREKIDTYVTRAETLKKKNNHLTTQEEFILTNSFEECAHADFLLESGRYREALAKYEKNISILLNLGKKLPDASMRQSFAAQLDTWLGRAEQAKEKLKSKQQPPKEDDEEWVPFQERQYKQQARPRYRSRYVDPSQSIGCRVQ